jgi:hypothetical protein
LIYNILFATPASGSWDWNDAEKSFWVVPRKDESKVRIVHVAGTAFADEEKTVPTIDKRGAFG